MRRWLRRLATIPLYLLITGVLLATSPLLFAFTVTADLMLRRRWGLTRGLACLLLYFTCESVGLIVAGVLWLASLLLPTERREAALAWNYALQRWWAGVLLGGVVRIFRLRILVDGADEIPVGPVHVLARHASIADTLLPAAFLARPTHRRLRYVLKRELLWDPCLDVVGQRVPNVFVHRQSDDSARERASVRNLAESLMPNEGTLIYPEGTRFTQAKRARILAKLEETSQYALLERARKLQHTLPPRPGGVVALLEGRPDADVVFLAHSGFEAATSLRNIWDGSLVGRCVRVAFWCVPHETIPTDHTARVAWLQDEWARVDAWVGASLAEDAG